MNYSRRKLKFYFAIVILFLCLTVLSLRSYAIERSSYQDLLERDKFEKCDSNFPEISLSEPDKKLRNSPGVKKRLREIYDLSAKGNDLIEVIQAMDDFSEKTKFNSLDQALFDSYYGPAFFELGSYSYASQHYTRLLNNSHAPKSSRLTAARYLMFMAIFLDEHCAALKYKAWFDQLDGVMGTKNKNSITRSYLNGMQYEQAKAIAQEVLSDNEADDSTRMHSTRTLMDVAYLDKDYQTTIDLALELSESFVGYMYANIAAELTAQELKDNVKAKEILDSYYSRTPAETVWQQLNRAASYLKIGYPKLACRYFDEIHYINGRLSEKYYDMLSNRCGIKKY